MVDWFISHWIIVATQIGISCALLLIGKIWGARSMRRYITKDFDVIIHRARRYMATGQMVQLDKFLHDLTDDEPYAPPMRVLAENMVRMGGNLDEDERERLSDDY